MRLVRRPASWTNITDYKDPYDTHTNQSGDPYKTKWEAGMQKYIRLLTHGKLKSWGANEMHKDPLDQY